MDTAPFASQLSLPESVLGTSDLIQDIHRRLQALASISNQLNTLRTERELVARVIDLLLAGFPLAQSVEIIVLEGEGDLSLLYRRDRVGALKIMECGGIDAL